MTDKIVVVNELEKPDFHKQRLVLFFKGQPFSAFFSFLLAGLLYFYYREKNTSIHHYWLLTQFACFAIRLGFVAIHKKEILKGKVLENTYAGVLFITAAAWGCVIYLYFPLSTEFEIAFPLIFPLSVLVGGVTKMGQSHRSSLSYTFGVISFFTSYYIVNWSSASYLMICAGSLFALFMFQTSKQNYKSYQELENAILENKEHLKELESKLKVEQELSLQKAITAQSSKLATLGEMAGGIAHEVNNPLHIIKNSALQIDRRLKKIQVEDDFIQKKVNNIQLTVDRVGKIIKGLLRISRTHDPSDLSKRNLKEVIQESLQLSEEKFKIAGIDLRIDLPEDIHIFVNDIAFSQVVINLLNNSYYFINTLEKPWVEIKLEKLENGMVSISFTDSGAPIPKEEQEKLFNPFFSTKKVGEGTGLGLSVSKTILQEVNGDLTFKDTDHPCFIITLPTTQYSLKDAA